MQTKKRILIVALIVLIFLVAGILFNFLWNYVKLLTHPQENRELVAKYAAEYEIPEDVVYAVIKVESDFDATAKSSVGALGLMQMMPSTFEWLTGEEHMDEHLPTAALMHPDVSIRYGVYYLRYLADKFGENWDTVCAAYNAGEGNVAKWLNDREYSDENGNLTYIPFEETRNYVQRINEAREIYDSLYYEES